MQQSEKAFYDWFASNAFDGRFSQKAAKAGFMAGYQAAIERQQEIDEDLAAWLVTELDMAEQKAASATDHWGKAYHNADAGMLMRVIKLLGLDLPPAPENEK